MVKAVLVPENHLRSCVISISGAGTLHTIYSIIRGATSDMRKSELPKWGLNELCCKRTVHRWNRLELNFPSMYSTGMSHSTQKLSLWGALTSTVISCVLVTTTIVHANGCHHYVINPSPHTIQ